MDLAHVWTGAALGCAGVVLVLHPTGQSFEAGALLALGGAVMRAVALIAVRMLGTTEPITRTLFNCVALSSPLVLRSPSSSVWRW